ncbi:hypothetical protein JCM33374_g6546 [Metschnikowia sp. JCM 33374]|nr:hypothetical protein JCM33374_g6546 [Metschnikowia sp. JCM 33374]
MQFPAPPKLKTTIIQLNKDIDPEDNNYEVLSNDYASDSTKTSSLSFSNASNEDQPKKKRRRSSSTVGEVELAKRRTETKQLHSMIEKRRRIKINREFEALKYLIPACRTADNGSRKPAVSNNNANKIDGMYKLTILKTSVEYILYLHHIIKKQHELLSSSVGNYAFDISFANIPLDVNQYRNIDQDFDFQELASKCVPQAERSNGRSTPLNTSLNSSSSSITETEEDTEAGTLSSTNPEILNWPSKRNPHLDQLPTPHITPEISPILTMLGKYKGDAKTSQTNLSESTLASEAHSELSSVDLSRSHSQDSGFISKSFSFASSKNHSGSTSTSTSPFTIPIKTSMKKNMFTLPDPALASSSANCGLISAEGMSVNNYSMSSGQSLPKKMYFKSQVPPQNLVANVGAEPSDFSVDHLEVDKLENASKTLLALRKPSIDRLLN